MLKEEEFHSFELSLVVRDSKGNPTNKRKVYRGDNANDLYDWYLRNSYKPKKKRKKRDKNDKAATAQQAEKLLSELRKTQGWDEQDKETLENL